MNYTELSLEIQENFRKSKIDFQNLEQIWLPKHLFNEFYLETVGRGYECTWFGIRVFGKDVEFITFVSRT